MSSMIKELYEGYMEDVVTKRTEDPEAEKISRECSELFDRLRMSLTPEQTEILDAYESASNRFGYYEEMNKFDQGFRLGVRLILDSFINS